MSAQRIRVPATLTGESLAELDGAIEAALESADSRVLVLHGTESTFCLGADFQSLLAGGNVERESRAFAELLARLLRSKKPLIAEVAGRAAAGGVGLAAATDLVLASKQATFALTEALFGGVPAIIAPALLRRMSPAKTTLWAVSGQTWSAAEAQAAALVDLCVDPAELDEAVRSWTRRLSRANQEAVGAFKRHLQAASGLLPADGVGLTTAQFEDPAVLERIRAFQEDGIAPWMRKED